jgi:predicted transcriptional regulator
MGRDTASELLGLASKRADVLLALHEGTRSKREMATAVDVSRPTVDRAFRELEDVGVLTSQGTTYELTSFGRLFCEQVDRIVRTHDTLAEARDLLSYLPRDTSIDMRLVEGATVHEAAAYAPQEAFKEVVDLVDEAEEVRGYSSTVYPFYVDVFTEQILDARAETTLVLTEDVVDTLERNYREEFEAVTAAENFDLYETPVVETYGVVLADGRVAVTVGDARDRMRGVVVNDTDEAAAWATEFLDSLVASGERVPAMDSPTRA